MKWSFLHMVNPIDWVVLAKCWLGVQMLCVGLLGINEQGEATKYIEVAKQIVDGGAPISLHNIWYAGYIAMHVVLRLLGLSTVGMYIVQLLLSLLSLLYFIRIVSIWTSSRAVLVFSGLLYSTCFIMQQWVSFLYTDAVFYMLLIIALYYLLQEDSSPRGKYILWCLLLALPFFRPVGILFVVLACLHWVITSNEKNVLRIVFGSVYIAVLLGLSYFILRSSAGYFYPLHNAQANVICGLPSGLLKYQVSPFNPNAGVVAYLYENPAMTARLFIQRLYKVFSLTRPYFSGLHNLVIAAASGLYYILALLGVITIIRERRRSQYVLIAGALVFSIPSILFCVEWTGRMSLPVFCFVLLLGVCPFSSRYR